MTRALFLTLPSLLHYWLMGSYWQAATIRRYRGRDTAIWARTIEARPAFPTRVLNALPCSRPRSDTRRVMPLTKRGGRDLFVHQNNILLGSLHNSNSQLQRGLRRAVPPPSPQRRSRGGWMAM